MLATANKFAFELIRHKLKEEHIMTIKHINGDLFKIAKETDYLAHCISKDYALGAGIAVEFQRRFRLREKLRRTEFPWLRSRIPTLWTNSYFIPTVGGAPLAMVKQYIENQKISQGRG